MQEVLREYGFIAFFDSARLTITLSWSFCEGLPDRWRRLWLPQLPVCFITPNTDAPLTANSQEGHKASECPEPKNPANFTCRNCDEKGHFAKECPLPKDWSKVKCSNCEQSKGIQQVLYFVY